MVAYVYIKIRTRLFAANSRCARAQLFMEREVPNVDVCKLFSRLRVNVNRGQG